MSKPAIALYLGETYATGGLFDVTQKSAPKLLFEKSVFLPQTSLKNLLSQLATKRIELGWTESDAPVFIVTKYFDRLKQFRLGGSVSQVILKGFENSYSIADSKALSLAAAQLIIPLEADKPTLPVLEAELERIKKINPDLNKVVIALPEDRFNEKQISEVMQFFETAGLKIFRCLYPYDQNELRKTLLNAGCDGTKEEITKEVTENLGVDTKVHFFCRNGFEMQFENAELFNSSNNFLANYLRTNKMTECAYFDIESFKFIRQNLKHIWPSPWGQIPLEYYDQSDLEIHPLAELKLNHLSMLSFEKSNTQLEPGPVLAGRAIKPLLIDLFHAELQENEFCNNLFSQMAAEPLKIKIKNIFTVLEKSQKNDLLASTIEDLKNTIQASLQDEIKLLSESGKCLSLGPLASLFGSQESKGGKKFSWVQEIAAAIPGDLL